MSGDSNYDIVKKEFFNLSHYVISIYDSLNIYCTSLKELYLGSDSFINTTSKCLEPDHPLSKYSLGIKSEIENSFNDWSNNQQENFQKLVNYLNGLENARLKIENFDNNGFKDFKLKTEIFKDVNNLFDSKSENFDIPLINIQFSFNSLFQSINSIHNSSSFILQQQINFKSPVSSLQPVSQPRPTSVILQNQQQQQQQQQNDNNNNRPTYKPPIQRPLSTNLNNVSNGNSNVGGLRAAPAPISSSNVEQPQKPVTPTYKPPTQRPLSTNLSNGVVRPAPIPISTSTEEPQKPVTPTYKPPIQRPLSTNLSNGVIRPAPIPISTSTEEPQKPVTPTYKPPTQRPLSTNLSNGVLRPAPPPSINSTPTSLPSQPTPNTFKKPNYIKPMPASQTQQQEQEQQQQQEQQSIKPQPTPSFQRPTPSFNKPSPSPSPSPSTLPQRPPPPSTQPQRPPPPSIQPQRPPPPSTQPQRPPPPSIQQQPVPVDNSYNNNNNNKNEKKKDSLSLFGKKLSTAFKGLDVSSGSSSGRSSMMGFGFPTDMLGPKLEDIVNDFEYHKKKWDGYGKRFKLVKKYTQSIRWVGHGSAKIESGKPIPNQLITMILTTPITMQSQVITYSQVEFKNSRGNVVTPTIVEIPNSEVPLYQADFHGPQEFDEFFCENIVEADLFSINLEEIKSTQEQSPYVEPLSEKENEIYLISTPTLNFNEPEFAQFIEREGLYPQIDGASQQQETLLCFSYRVSLYIKLHISYEISCGDQKPLVTINKGLGNCSSYSNLFCSIMRYNGIPCRILSGVVSRKNNVINEPHGQNEFYLPNIGWVPYNGAVMGGPNDNSIAFAKCFGDLYSYMIDTHINLSYDQQQSKSEHTERQSICAEMVPTKCYFQHGSTPSFGAPKRDHEFTRIDNGGVLEF
ncbi:hypothetical protein ACTFIW_002300 [Dictyostelium discoideum]